MTQRIRNRSGDHLRHSLIKIEERKKLKNILNNSRTRAVKQTAGEACTRTNREVKRSVRRDERNLQQKRRKLQVRITSKLFMITSNSLPENTRKGAIQSRIRKEVH